MCLCICSFSALVCCPQTMKRNTIEIVSGYIQQQRSRRTSQHPQAGNDESTSQQVRFIRNEDKHEDLNRLKDIVRRLAVEEHPSPEHSRFTSHPPGAPTAGQSGNSTKNGEIRSGRPGLKRATVEGRLARSLCRSRPEELTRAARIIKPGMNVNVDGVPGHNGRRLVRASKEAILEKR